jgi:endonuclease/exonuclease/phosphatase family metal-dependent hydrolase
VRARVVVFWLAVAAFVLPALVLTICRVVQPSGQLGIAAVAFTPWAIPMYAVALVLAAVRLLVVRRWRGGALPVVLVAVAGLVAHGWWYAPQVIGANPPAAAGATPLVVISANLRLGNADGVELVRIASEERADLLVVQEVTQALLADMERAGLADLLPYRIGTPGRHATGTMAFARVELTDPVRVPTYFGGWGFEMGGMRVLAVHPTYPLDPSGWARDHEVVAEAVADQEPDLLLGDFNATMDHAPMRDLADRGYRDVGELANNGWQPTWPADGSFDRLGLPLAQIDHVLVDTRLAALGMHTVDVPDTDHRAVVARVAPK